MRKNDIQISANFRLYEFESPDTQEVIVHPLLVQKLQQLRERIGRPIHINSAYRTPEHNKAIGGAKNSEHPKGTAADLDCPEGMSIDQFAAECEAVGFDGIGKYHTFVHVDVRGYKARWDERR